MDVAFLTIAELGRRYRRRELSPVEEGLPLSLQIAAAPFAEGLVLRIAHACQEATGWHRRYPALA